jgi:peptidoglycan/LPS O-acetylase OafA/YrhL
MYDLGLDAVMVFFVLSGFVIAYTSERESTATIFVASRIARLWSVLLPALLITAVADAIGVWFNPNLYSSVLGGHYADDHAFTRLLVNGLFLN